MTWLGVRLVRLLSLRARLGVFALLCSAPLLALILLDASAEEDRIRADASLRANVMAQHLLERIQRLVASAESVAYAIGALDLTDPGSVSSCSAALARAARASGTPFINYSVLSPAGNVLCSARPATPGVNFADRPYFMRALATKSPALSGYTLGRVTRQEALQLAVPQLDERNEVRTVAVVALLAPALAESGLSSADLPGVLALFDADGVLVSRAPASAAVPAGRSYADSALWRGITATAVPAELAGLDGVLRHYAVRTFMFHDQPALRIAVGVDVDALESAAAELRRHQLLVVLVVAALAVAIGLLATRPLVIARTRPLVRAAERVAEGRYGERVPLEVRDELRPVEAGFNAMLDAIERDRALLQSREHRYRMLFEHSLDAVLHTRPDGSILAANPAACRLLGSTEDELVRRTRAELVDVQDPRLAPLLAQRRAEGAARGELTFIRHDGQRFEASVSSAIYHDESGDELAYIVFHDITERKAAQQQIEQLNRELEDRVQRRTEQLQTLNRELEAFSYSVSHDLRSPVGVIRSFAGLLAERKAVQGERYQHYLERIQAAGAHMSDLIEGLLSLSQLSRSTVDMQPVNLSVLTGDVVRELRDAHPGREVITRVAPHLECMGDPRLLRVLLANLIGNAWKFTRHQAVARTEVGWLHGPSGETIYFVADNGAGFDNAHAPGLFEPFQRYHTTAEFPGIGIGLATVQRIVHRHGGRVWATSRPGEGATFYFVLATERPPAAEARVTPAQAAAA